jgi:hypothetical protein
MRWLDVWFKPRYSVCKECQVHFEPATGEDEPWGFLCPMHRKPVMELDKRKEAVIAWCRVNWVMLESQYLEDMPKGYNENAKGNSAAANYKPIFGGPLSSSAVNSDITNWVNENAKSTAYANNLYESYTKEVYDNWKKANGIGGIGADPGKGEGAAGFVHHKIDPQKGV